MQKFGTILLTAMFSAVLSISGYKYFESPKFSDSSKEGEAKYTSLVDKLLSTRSNAAQFSAAPTNFIAASAVSTQAVVNIRTLQVTDPGFWGNGSVTGSSGSGVIIAPDGYIVTNHHVVNGSSDIKITMADKREYKAKLVGSDPSTDIALIKIDADKLPFLLFGNSDSLHVGEWVLAVGNPFNLESTVTAGIVSAKARNINILGGGTSIESFIQTDAAVNPGNSGGALVNTFGELIGINTAIITETGNYEGYSFAVPSNLAQKVIKDLIEYGRVQRGFLGIGIEDLDTETANQAGLSNLEGVLVNRINVNSGADDAGLLEGDIILAINKMRIKTTPELQEIVGRFRPGDAIKIDYWRNSRKQQTTLVLKDINNGTVVAKNQGNELEDKFGLALRDLKPGESDQLKIRGAMVTSIRRGSIIDLTNMQPGFVITGVSGNRVTNMNEAIAAIQSSRGSISLDGFYEQEPDLYSYRFKKPI